jgi:cytochrome c biogenesis protein CcmG/thiol:disulfide interchange protein DsbE
VGADRDGRAAVDWGVYGVPETFVVDGTGLIRFKHIGPLSADSITGVLAPEIEKAKAPLPKPGG